MTENRTKYKGAPVVESLEKAIELCLANDTDYAVEWYSLGKTNADFRDYVRKEGIDQRALGVFVSGSEHNNPAHRLVVMPRSWIVESDSGPGH
jgi:hypothetical protein